MLNKEFSQHSIEEQNFLLKKALMIKDTQTRSHESIIIDQNLQIEILQIEKKQLLSYNSWLYVSIGLAFILGFMLRGF